MCHIQGWGYGKYRSLIEKGKTAEILEQLGFDVNDFCNSFQNLRDCLDNNFIETTVSKNVRAKLAMKLGDLSEIKECDQFQNQLIAKLRIQISDKTDDQLLSLASKIRLRPMYRTRRDGNYHDNSGNNTSYYGDGSTGGQGDGNSGENGGTGGNSTNDYDNSGDTGGGSDEGNYYNHPPNITENTNNGDLYQLYYDDVFQDNIGRYERIKGEFRTGDIIAIVALICIGCLLFAGFGYVLYQKYRVAGYQKQVNTF